MRCRIALRSRIPGLAFLCILGVLPLPGCGGSSYELTLVPEGNSLSRSLVFSDGTSTEPPTEEQAAGSAPPDEAARLAAIYGTGAVESADGTYQFRKTFSGRMPDDVGGDGEFTRKETSLGSLHIYRERFRGSYDLAQSVEKRFEAAEELSDLLAHWVRTAGRESPLRNRLEQVVREEFEQDLKNLVMLTFSIADAGHENDRERFWMQLGQYGSEQGYLNLDLILQATSGGKSEAEAIRLLRKILMLKLQVEQEQLLLRTWPALASAESFRSSLDQVIEATESYARRAEGMRQNDPEKELPQGSSMLVGLLLEAVGIYFLPTDSVTIYLACPHEPLLDNGEWLEEEKRLRWELHLPERTITFTNGPPDLCYAVWSEPNIEFQQTLFGRVLLEGERLATYCSWRASLNSKEAAEWERSLESLEGNSDPLAALAAFEFSGPPENLSPAAQEFEPIESIFRDAITSKDPDE